MLPRSAPVSPPLFWFLGVFLLHALASLVLFTVGFGAPDGPVATASSRAFTILQWPVGMPLLGSVVWAGVIATVAALRHRRRAVSDRR